MIEQNIPKNWKTTLQSEFKKTYFKQLMHHIDKSYQTEIIYPKKEQIFKALELTSLENCKVVILGQDPYHGKDQANGLAFSVNEKIKTPPSLKNILLEVENNTKIKKTNKDLTSWAKQGVLLINSILTVKAKTPQSHDKIGWQQFTDKIIKLLDNKKTPIVFMLWGNFAKSKEKIIKNPIHLKLKASHPSPLSAHKSFLGCNHFKLANEFLIKTKQNPINWNK